MTARKICRLTILQMNDTHGYLEPHPELIWHGREPAFPVLGGYARIAGLFNAVRSERPGAVSHSIMATPSTAPILRSPPREWRWCH